MREKFRRFAQKASDLLGTPNAFFVGAFTIFLWIATGPLFNFSDGWQLVMNTYTNVVTFLMVFLLQSAQNRDSRVTHVKLDELLRAQRKARKSVVDAERLSDTELEKIKKKIIKSSKSKKIQR